MGSYTVQQCIISMHAYTCTFDYTYRDCRNNVCLRVYICVWLIVIRVSYTCTGKVYGLSD